MGALADRRKNTLGGRLTAARQAAGLTQVEVARLLGITQSQYSAIERGGCALTLDRAVQVARVLRVSLDSLTGLSCVS